MRENAAEGNGSRRRKNGDLDHAAGVIFPPSLSLSLPMLSFSDAARRCLAYHSVALFCPRLLSAFEPWNNKYNVNTCQNGHSFDLLSNEVEYVLRKVRRWLKKE